MFVAVFAHLERCLHRAVPGQHLSGDRPPACVHKTLVSCWGRPWLPSSSVSGEGNALRTLLSSDPACPGWTPFAAPGLRASDPGTDVRKNQQFLETAWGHSREEQAEWVGERRNVCLSMNHGQEVSREVAVSLSVDSRQRLRDQPGSRPFPRPALRHIGSPFPRRPWRGSCAFLGWRQLAEVFKGKNDGNTPASLFFSSLQVPKTSSAPPKKAPPRLPPGQRQAFMTVGF